MLDIVRIYCDLVIKPTEEARNEMRAKVYSRNFFDWLSRGLYKEYLEKYNEMLFKQYKKLNKLIEEEKIFYQTLKGVCDNGSK